MKKTEVIQDFLKRSSSPIALLYNPSMEVQVNVAKDGGEYVKGIYNGKHWKGWTDGIETWKSFRIPWNADTSPNYVDSDLKFDFFKHVEAIGMTGWDWENKVSRWVGYDFDSLVNHEAGLTEEQLSALIDATMNVEWVTLLRSTSGKGVHIYINFDVPIPTKTHTEHAALARSLISLLTIETGFNYQATVDCVGSVLWCYHRKSEGTNGLTVMKQGSLFNSLKVPKNWMSHLPVTNMTRKKTKAPKNVEILSSSVKNLVLDPEHQRILKWLSTDAKKDWWWDTDYSMLVCHTLDLKACHDELKLKGIFETLSSGSTDQNCFCFPSKGGSFVVRRHGTNVREAKTWIIDESGWTKCTFNSSPSFHDVCVVFGGQEDAKGAYIFNEVSQVIQALKIINIQLTIEERFEHRRCYVRQKGNKLIVAVARDSEDTKPKGFLQEPKAWVKVITHFEEMEPVHAQESIVRHVISNGNEAGWYVLINGEWVGQSKSNVTSVLVSQLIGYKRIDIDRMMGLGILDPWTLVQKPFEEEYLSNRRWNRDAAQISFQPIGGKFSHWVELFQHLGGGLDEVVKKNQWCIMNNVITGGDYLMLWVASMFQKPTEPLPYLFFFGSQNTGKSTFHEALTLLFKNGKGSIRADRALKDKSGFNGELENAVLCVVEETDLSRERTASERIKDWVTGRTISIRGLYQKAYDIVNTTHWVQCANDAKNVLILKGDTRILAIEVQRLDNEIPKRELLELLKDEASAFLYEILNMSLPEASGRLSVPCLETEIKKEMMASNVSWIDRFVENKCEIVAGHLTHFSDFYTAFRIYLSQNSPSDIADWTESKVMREMPRLPDLIRGRLKDGSPALGNMSLTKGVEPTGNKYIIDNGELILC